MKTIDRKALDYYMNLDYPITFYKAPEGGFVAEIEDLPGCLTQGETPEETLKNIEATRRDWIETAYEDEVDIPTPRTDTEYSGKFNIRIPKSLHRKLVMQAAREGVSLNQYVESILSNQTGQKEAFEKIMFALYESRSPKMMTLLWQTPRYSGQPFIADLLEDYEQGVGEGVLLP